MYKIGEFSKITQLTIKTLRYYDEEKILEPSARGENDYRYYSQKDFEKAQMILLLRKLGFSISEIKDAIAGSKDYDELKFFLMEKKQLIHKKIKEEKALMKEIDAYLTPTPNKEEKSMSYKMEVKEVEAVKVVSLRYKGAYSEVGNHIGKLFKAAKSQVAGAPMNCYYDGEYQDVADIELCLPVKGTVVSNEVTVKQLPGIKALATTHVGSYETLNLAYKALTDYGKENDLEFDLPSREIYIKGPGMVLKGNPANYVTEILLPIKERK